MIGDKDEGMSWVGQFRRELGEDTLILNTESASDGDRDFVLTIINYPVNQPL